MTIADVLRDCRCVDPENCNEPVPGRKCRRASMHAVCSGCGNLTTGKDHVCIGDAPVRWYPCACGAEHDTPTCPFGAEHSLSPDVRRQLAEMDDDSGCDG